MEKEKSNEKEIKKKATPTPEEQAVDELASHLVGAKAWISQGVVILIIGMFFIPDERLYFIGSSFEILGYIFWIRLGLFSMAFGMIYMLGLFVGKHKKASYSKKVSAQTTA